MCGIAGIISKDGRDISEQIKKMLETLKRADCCGLMIGDRIQKGNSIDDLDLNEKGDIAMGHTGLAIVDLSSQQLFDFKRNLILIDNSEIYNFEKLSESTGGGHGFTASETIMHLIEEHYSGNLEKTISEVIPQLDGVYAMAVSDGEEIVIARDMIGVKQLYMGENEKYFAFSSERKALWEVGINDEIHLLPGHIARLSPEDSVVKKIIEPPVNQKKRIYNIYEAIDAYREVLIEAVMKRVNGHERAGVVFSGGIDSVLITKIASMFTDVTCYTAGLSGSKDLMQARLAASKMGVKIKIKELDVKDVESYIPKVMEAIEDRLFLQVEAGIPVYAALEMACKDGQKIVLSGQGPDELFGGYPWYQKVLGKDGYEKLEQYMLDDLQRAYCETLEREVKMAEANGISLRYPYVDPRVIKVAIEMDIKLKIRSAEDKLGKYVHRELAKHLGVPKDIADRPKEAAQHGSGVHKAMLEVAKRNGFVKGFVDEIRYDPEKSIREKLGSSIRYGYKYESKTLWAVPEHLQLYLDLVSLEEHLVSESELEYVKNIL